MPRFFVGNFEFEHVLANRHFQPSQRLKQLNAELATSWLAIAGEGDFLWLPEPIACDLLVLTSLGLPCVTPVTSLDDIPSRVELVPWGWTDPLMQLARLRRWEFAAPHPNTVRDANSRRFSFDLETEWQIGLPGASVVSELSQLEEAINLAKAVSPRTVIKANFGMSARERILIDDSLTDADRAWTSGRLIEQGVIFVEPWVTRREEAGIQIQIPKLGTPQLIGVTALVCDAAGKYRGSWFTEPTDAGPDFHERWQPAVAFALRAAERLQDRGYFGPLGIDAMRYQLPDGSIHLRPLQDVNARWTMGRLSLGWRKFLRDGERGFWWQSARSDADEVRLHNVQSSRVIDLDEAATGSQRISRVYYVTPATSTAEC